MLSRTVILEIVREGSSELTNEVALFSVDGCSSAVRLKEADELVVRSRVREFQFVVLQSANCVGWVSGWKWEGS